MTKLTPNNNRAAIASSFNIKPVMGRMEASFMGTIAREKAGHLYQIPCYIGVTACRK